MGWMTLTSGLAPEPAGISSAFDDVSRCGGPVVGFSGSSPPRSACSGRVSGFGCIEVVPGGILGTVSSGCTTSRGFSTSVAGGDGNIGAAAGVLWFACGTDFSSMTSFESCALVLVALAVGACDTCCGGFARVACDRAAGVFAGWAESVVPSSCASSGAEQQFKKESRPFFFLVGATLDLLADPGLAAFSSAPAAWRADRLLLVLPSLRRPVRLRFELRSTFSDVRCAESPPTGAAELP